MEVTAHAQAASASPVYSRRQPEKTALCKVLQQHLLTFEQQWTDQSDGRTLPSFVTDELHAFMSCGILGRGFAHLFCEILCTKCKAPLRLIALIKSEDTAKKILDAMHLPSELGPAHPTPAPRGFAAPVAKLHPARPPPTSCWEAGGTEDWVN